MLIRIFSNSKCESRQPRIRLFCFPYAGGSALPFKNWGDHLSANIEAFVVSLPGRGALFRESPIRNLKTLTEHLINRIDFRSGERFVFFGHSMGALISFEMARLLRQHSLPAPMHLFVSGCSGPCCDAIREQFFHLPDDEFIRELKKLNGLPGPVLADKALMGIFLPILRADLEACQTYQYVHQAPLGSAITAFGGTEDKITQMEIANWRDQTDREFDMHMVPGDHFFIEHQWKFIVDIINEKLALICSMIAS